MKRKLSGIFVFTILAFSQNMYGGFFSKTFNNRVLSFLRTNRSTITVFLCSSSIVGLMGVFCYRQNMQIGKQNMQIGKQNTQIDILKKKNTCLIRNGEEFKRKLTLEKEEETKVFIGKMEIRERKRIFKQAMGWLDLNNKCIAEIGGLFENKSKKHIQYDEICKKYKICASVELLNDRLSFDYTE